MGADATLVLQTRDGQRFRFDSGALCMDLVCTGGRGERAVFETLHTPADVEAWVRRSRLAARGELPAALRVGEHDLAELEALREVLWRAANDLADGRELDGTTVAALNCAAASEGLVPVLDRPSGRRAWASPVTGAQVVAEVARDAVETFGGPLRERVRRCDGYRCALVFVDTSRPGGRRWCSMQRCGGRAKTRAFRDRNRTGGSEEAR